MSKGGAIPPLLFFIMTYEVNLLPAQREFWEIPHNYPIDIALYQGGYGSGKTFSGSLLGLTLALKYPKIRGMVGAQTYSLVRDTTLQSYLEHLDNLGLKYNYSKTEQVLSLPNGSEILFRHFEDPERLKSLNLGFIEVEEMSDIEYSSFLILLSRLRQPKRPEWGEDFKYRLFGHTNPQASRGWIYDVFVKHPQNGYRRILAPSTQNKYLPDGYLDLLKGMYNEEYYRIMVLGEDSDNFSGLVTIGFNKEEQVKAGLQIKKELPIHITCDFNVDPMCWYIAQHYDGNIYYLHELTLSGVTTDSATEVLCELLRDYKNNQIIINGDASGNFNTTKGTDYIFMKNAFARNGFVNIKLQILRNNPQIEYRVNCWNNKIRGVDGKPHIFIHPQCDKLIYNLENLEVKAGTSKPKLPTSKQIEKDERLKYLGHPFDAASYLVAMYYPIKTVHYNEVKPTDNQGIDVFGGRYDKRLI